MATSPTIGSWLLLSASAILLRDKSEGAIPAGTSQRAGATWEKCA